MKCPRCNSEFFPWYRCCSTSYVDRLKLLVRAKLITKKEAILEGLPESTGSNKCQKCGSTQWKSANTDPNQHWLKSDVIECSDCTEGTGPK